MSDNLPQYMTKASQRKKPRSAVTLKDLAAVAEVNVSTVSRALNDSNEVGQETKERIRALAEKMSYVPNLSARALAGKGSRLIGVVVPEIRSNYYAKVIDEIEAVLNAKHYSSLLGKTNFRVEEEINYVIALSQRKVDGIIMADPVHAVVGDLDRIRERCHQPILFLEPASECEHYDHVKIDNEYGINAAVEYLASRGIKVFAYVGDELSASMRLPMFERALGRAGLPFYKSLAKVGPERFELGGYLRMQGLLKEKRKPEAVFATCDHMAFGAMKAITESGMQIPRDISIFGFGDITEAEYMQVPLTTISPPVREMVRIGADTLLDRIENDSHGAIRSISLKPELVIRASTR